MKLTTREDLGTRERVLCLRISQSDVEDMELSNKEKSILDFCEKDGLISSKLLAVAVIARRIEKKRRQECHIQGIGKMSSNTKSGDGEHNG